MKMKKIIVALTLAIAIGITVTSVNAARYIDTATEKWDVYVGTNLYVCYWQNSDYWHKNVKHYANAMMNGVYSGRVWAEKNKWAKADSPCSWGGYNTHKSYYGY